MYVVVLDVDSSDRLARMIPRSKVLSHSPSPDRPGWFRNEVVLDRMDESRLSFAIEFLGGVSKVGAKHLSAV